MVLLEPYDSFGPIQSAGAYDDLVQHLGEFGDQMMEYTKFSIEKGSKITAGDYMRVQERVAELKATFDDAFETYDLIISPVSRFPAFPNDDPFPGSITGGSSYPAQFWNGAFTMHANAIGHPAASIPAGFSSDCLPIGLQILGRRYAEATVLAASAAFEKARPWIQDRPPVS
jgi:amidase